MYKRRQENKKKKKKSVESIVIFSFVKRGELSYVPLCQ